MKIKLNDTQAHILIRALDLYLRTAIGQLQEAVCVMSDSLVCPEEVKAEVGAIKRKLMNLDLHESLGVGHPRLKQEYNEAYSMVKILQKHVATKEEHHGFSVWHDGNLLEMNREPAIEVEE